MPPDSTLRDSLARAPLPLVAVAFTAGVMASRWFELPFFLCALLGAAFLVSFVAARFDTRRPSLPIAYLMLAAGCTGAALFSLTGLVAADDIAHNAGAQPVPVVLRAYLEGEPRRRPAPAQPDPLQSLEEVASASVVVQVRALVTAYGEEPRSGRVRLLVTGLSKQPAEELLKGLHACDEVEISGRLESLRPATNPGEYDRADRGHLIGVRALVRARPGAVLRVAERWYGAPVGWLGLARSRAHAALERSLPGGTSPLARALVLGEGAPLQAADWGKFVRTGVIHVLAISGQHLVIVGAFLWLVLRGVGVPQTRAALLVAVVLLLYALLTGGRPPALRAAVMACGVGVGIALCRPISVINLFALCWLVVGLVRPADYFDIGCHLSFWATGVITWVGQPLLEREVDPLDQLIAQSRPLLWRCLYSAADHMGQMYKLCFIVWLAITPLVAWHTGMIAPAALLLGPPLALLASLALLMGLIVLALSWFPPLAGLVGWGVHGPLAVAEGLVNLAEQWPLHVRLPPVPGWWVLPVVVLVIWCALYPPRRTVWPWAVGLGWLIVLFAVWLIPLPRPAEVRLTFADVGHGGCTLIEFPDGRTVLYDAGSMRGGTGATAVIVPLLHARGVRRLDAIILSHADLDHFNGVAGLLDHFAVGRAYCSESFTEKRTDAVAHTLATLERRGVPLIPVAAGDRIEVGETVLDVLHPPRGWVGHSENARSVVVELSYRGRSALLTGDLEGEGLARVLHQPARRADILQVPHHGSFGVDLPALVKWCGPSLAISCQGPPRSLRTWQLDCPLWTTWDHGAITVEWGERPSAWGHHSRQLWMAGPR